MRILLVSAEYPPLFGGVGDYTANLFERLRARGHATRVLTSLRVRDDERPDVVLAVDAWGYRHWGAILREVRSWRPDVVHIQYQAGAYALHPAVTLLPWRLKVASGVPVTPLPRPATSLPLQEGGPLRHWRSPRSGG